MTNELTQAELEKRIAGISETMKAPFISDVERTILHMDRKDLRLALATLKDSFGVTS